MAKSTDERGRIYLPEDIRERFGEQYRIVGLPSHVALFPVDEDPLDGLQAAASGVFTETDVAELKMRAREEVSREVHVEARDRAQDGTE